MIWPDSFILIIFINVASSDITCGGGWERKLELMWEVLGRPVFDFFTGPGDTRRCTRVVHGQPPCNTRRWAQAPRDTTWHKALRTDPPPGHNALRTGPPPWHNALRTDPPPWHNALRTKPPHDTTRCARTRPRDTTRCATGRAMTQGVAHRPAPVTRRVAHRPAPVTQRVAHKAPPWHKELRTRLRRRILAMDPEATWMRRYPCKPYQIPSELYRGSNPPRTRRHNALRTGPPPWHDASRTDPPPWHNALRTKPPVTQRVAQQAVPWHKAWRTDPPPWHDALRTGPPPWHNALRMHKAPPMTQRVAHAQGPRVAQHLVSRDPEDNWMRRCPCKPYQISSELYRGSNPPRTRWHNASRTDAPPWHNALRTRPPRDTTRCATGRAMTQGVAHRPAPVTRRFAHSPPPVTQRVAHKAPPMTQGVAPAPVTQGADRPPASSGAAFWQWALTPLGKPYQISSKLYRSSNPPRTRWLTRRAQTRPHDTTRCAQGPPVTQRVAQQAVPWHKALRTCRPAPVTRRVAHRPAPVTRRVAHRPAPVTQRVAHKAPHKALCADRTIQRLKSTQDPVTQRVAHRPAPVTQRVAHRPAPMTQRVAHKAPHDTTRCAQTRPRDTTRCATGPAMTQGVAHRPAPVTQRVAHRPASMTQRVAHKAHPRYNALRNRPCHDTTRCAQTRPRDTTRCAQGPPHDTRCCARPCDTRRWQAAGLLGRRILAMGPEATWMRRCPCKPY